MAHTLRISDGSTTVDLRGTNYALLYGTWAPKRARRAKGLLGGLVYENVSEQMDITISGTNEADVLTKLTTLSDLLDQAERWSAGENVDAVYVEYEPPGSGLASSVKAVITGPPGDGDFLQLPGNTDIIITEGRYQLGTIPNPLVLGFSRHGMWLGAAETEVSANSTGNPVVRTTSTFTDDAATPRPYDLEIELDLGVGNYLPGSTIYALLSNAAANLLLEEAEGFAGTGTSSEVVSGASGGSVRRFDAEANTNAKNMAKGLASNFYKKVALFAMVRNRSASAVNWSIWAAVTGSGVTATGRKKVIAAGDNVRQIVPLGILTSLEYISNVAIYAQNDALGGASDVDDLDIDYVAGVAVDENSSAIKFTITTQSVHPTDRLISVEQRLLTHPEPLVLIRNTAKTVTTAAPIYEGMINLHANSNVISGIVMGNDTAGANWVIEDSAGTAANVLLRAIRSAGYLVPK